MANFGVHRKLIEHGGIERSSVSQTSSEVRDFAFPTTVNKHSLPCGIRALSPFGTPKAVDLGIVNIGLVKKRDDKYNISTDAIKTTRVDLPEPERLNP
nr:oil body-associated protein 2A-like isoform X1 [Nicotiana tomentosiformis]